MNQNDKSKKNTHVHFMGIGGSGMAACAMIAKAQGYHVTGCDLQESTPYLGKLRESNVEIYVGHDASHMKNADILAVTAAVFYQNKKHEEVKAGQKKQFMQWQTFLGSYLQKDKRVMCVTGTHGKSTTTTMLGLLYEHVSYDPTVEVGANVLSWGANYRIGKSNIFINEADEFYNNFLNYHPDVIILNNIEFDHPDFFTSEEDVLESFENFIANIRGEKILIINQDSEGNAKLFDKLKKQDLNCIGYTIGENAKFSVEDSFVGTIQSKGPEGTVFRVENKLRGFLDTFTLQVPGEHNVSNALGVVAQSVLDDLPIDKVQQSLQNFEGTGRRVEFIGEKENIRVYDDYAHHPTEIKASLQGLRQRYPNKYIFAIVEPHMFSRTKILLNSYIDVFEDANSVVIAPIFKSRDTHNHGVSNKSIVGIVKHSDIRALDSFEEIKEYVLKNKKEDMVIIVMGAGKSYQLAKDIYNSL